MKKWFAIVLTVTIALAAVVVPLYVKASTNSAAASTNYTVYITKAGTGGGTITPSIGTITWTGNTGTTSDNASSTVYFYVTPSLGSVFQSWTGCDAVSDNGTCTLTLSSDNKSLTVTFGGISTYALTVAKTGFGGGTIVPSIGSLSWSSNSGTATYNSNQTVALYPTADNASRFYFWKGCDSVSDNGTCAIMMKSNASVTARFSGYHSVTYSFPYLHTDSSSVVYCMVSNFSTDKATEDGFSVMSNAQQTATQIPYELPAAFTIGNGRTAMVIFSNQKVAIKNDNLTTFTIGDNNSISIVNDTCTNCSYGARIRWTSSFASGYTGINCLNLVLSCFQGTTLPKRNLIGYFCSDDSVTGPGGRSNLISY